MSVLLCDPPSSVSGSRTDASPAADRPRPETPAAAAPAGELTDAQWATIEPLLPPRKSRGRHRSTDLRRVVTAINHRWHTGVPWRDLPPGFPPWPTIYTYFRTWLKDGTLRRLRAILNPPKPSDLAASPRKAGPPPAKLDPDRGPRTNRPTVAPLNPR